MKELLKIPPLQPVKEAYYTKQELAKELNLSVGWVQDILSDYPSIVKPFIKEGRRRKYCIKEFRAAMLQDRENTLRKVGL